MNTLKTVIQKAGGVAAGAHKCTDPQRCILEAISEARGLPLTDDPEVLGVFDARNLNDSDYWPSEEARTAAMERLGMAMWGMWEWSPERCQRAAEAIALGTLNRVLPLILEGEAAGRCRSAKTLAEGFDAARAAADAAADAADAAAHAGGYAADYAAADAAADAADAARAVLETAVEVWVSALERSAL